MGVTFCYVQGMRGPEPQRWETKQTNGAGVEKKTLQTVDLPDTYASLPLDQLVQLYPYKGAIDVA
jgi:hypothetical protein